MTLLSLLVAVASATVLVASPLVIARMWGRAPDGDPLSQPVLGRQGRR
ncbi:hypothetical protein LWC35_05450 [Pseudonocardia kujensis]|nr:hypothetical protein [Pseudonocardia kujensis]MCE0762358.1 hypothetical protein [Pseudonocardia kujensis]